MNEFDENNRLTRREYGRNVQNLVKYIMTLEDKPERTEKAATLIDLMKLLNPSIREYPEYNQKLWDELFIMSDFKLDADCPYPIPDKNILTKKPNRMGNNAKGVRYKHYGKNIELLVKKATTLEDPEEQEAATIHVGKLMKTFFSTWNRDTISDDVIMKNITDLSNGSLKLDMEKVKNQNLFESTIRERDRDKEISREQRDMRGGKGKRRNFKRRKN